jgi:phenylacetate-coenzyme A ligase PaaK-like adenylate-forming protein
LLGEGLARIPAQSKVHWPVRDLAQVAAEIAEHGFDAMVGAPAQVFALARHPAGRALGKGVLKGVLLSTDYVPRAVVHEIKAVWGCPVYEHYGMTETGYGGGVHCATLCGYHLREADLLCEVIDPHTGRPCPPGVAGEVVFTTLTRRAMPLIRYRTGDMAAFLADPCPCGSWLPRLGEVQGRLAGGVDLHGNIRLTMPRLDEVVLPVAGVVGYAARLEATSQGDRLHLILYCLPEQADAAQEAARDAVSCMSEVRSAGDGFRLEVEARSFRELTWEASGMIKREVGGA